MENKNCIDLKKLDIVYVELKYSNGSLKSSKAQQMFLFCKFLSLQIST